MLSYLLVQVGVPLPQRSAGYRVIPSDEPMGSGEKCGLASIAFCNTANGDKLINNVRQNSPRFSWPHEDNTMKSIRIALRQLNKNAISEPVAERNKARDWQVGVKSCPSSPRKRVDTLASRDVLMRQSSSGFFIKCSAAGHSVLRLMG